MASSGDSFAAEAGVSIVADVCAGSMANKASEGAVGADASMSGAQLPMEVWRQVALRMSTHEMAKGLVQTCKSLRHLSTSAVCLSSGSGTCCRSDSAEPLQLSTHVCGSD